MGLPLSGFVLQLLARIDQVLEEGDEPSADQRPDQRRDTKARGFDVQGALARVRSAAIADHDA